VSIVAGGLGGGLSNAMIGLKALHLDAMRPLPERSQLRSMESKSPPDGGLVTLSAVVYSRVARGQSSLAP
jgi:hypothetical protein